MFYDLMYDDLVNEDIDRLKDAGFILKRGEINWLINIPFYCKKDKLELLSKLFNGMYVEVAGRMIHISKNFR